MSDARDTGRSIPVFTQDFLDLLDERDDAPTALEAELAGPWAVRQVDGGWGVFRLWEDPRRARPLAVARDRRIAALLAAVAPARGTVDAWELGRAPEPDGYPVRHAGSTLAHLAVFDAELFEAFRTAHHLARRPHDLAALLHGLDAASLRAGGEIAWRLAGQVET